MRLITYHQHIAFPSQCELYASRAADSSFFLHRGFACCRHHRHLGRERYEHWEWEMDTVVNWDANGVPVSNLTTTDVVFGGNFHLTPLMDATYSIHQLTFASGAGAFNLSSNSTTTPETLTIGTGGITNSSSNVQTISSPLVLGAAQTWNASTAGLTINSATVANGGFLLTISGANNTSIAAAISGTGGLTKTGAGILTLNGTTANTSTGLTTVNAGELDLGKTANVNAIGSGGMTINAGTVKYTGTSTDEIADTANVTLSGGTLDLNNHADTIGRLTFNSGTLTSTGGTQTLTLAGSTGTTLQMQGAATIPTSVNIAFSSTTTSGVGMTFDASANGTATINGILISTTPQLPGSPAPSQLTMAQLPPIQRSQASSATPLPRD